MISKGHAAGDMKRCAVGSANSEAVVDSTGVVMDKGASVSLIGNPPSLFQVEMFQVTKTLKSLNYTFEEPKCDMVKMKMLFKFGDSPTLSSDKKLRNVVYLPFVNCKPDYMKERVLYKQYGDESKIYLDLMVKKLRSVL